MVQDKSKSVKNARNRVKGAAESARPKEFIHRMRSVTEFVAPLSRIQAAFHNKNLVLGGRKLSGASMSLSTYSEYDPADKQLTRNPHLRGYRKSAAVFSFLDRLARHIAVRTEHAAITGFRPEKRMTMFTFIKPLAGIGRHSFHLLAPAFGAGNG